MSGVCASVEGFADAERLVGVGRRLQGHAETRVLVTLIVGSQSHKLVTLASGFACAVCGVYKLVTLGG